MKTVSKNKEKLVTKVFQDVFDKYDPPSKSYNERLAHIEKAKLAQAKVQEQYK